MTTPLTQERKESGINKGTMSLSKLTKNNETHDGIDPAISFFKRKTQASRLTKTYLKYKNMIRNV